MVWRVGYHNDKGWLTPLGNYSLPASLNTSMNLTMNLSDTLSKISFYIAINPGSMVAVCAILLARNDWNGTAFTTNAAAPSRQIYVCQNSVAASQGTFIMNVSYAGIVYSVYDQTLPWTTVPTHMIVSSLNQTSWSVDLFTIFNDIYARRLFPTNEVLVGIEMGMHIYFGVGMWNPSSLSLTAIVANPPSPAPAPIPVPVPQPNATNITNNNSTNITNGSQSSSSLFNFSSSTVATTL